MSEKHGRRGTQLECLLLLLTFFGLAAHGQDIAAKKQPVPRGLSSLPMEAQARISLIDSIVQLAELTASDGATQDFFGEGVAISGNTLVVGAPGGIDSGSAYVFVKPASGWANMTQTAILTTTDGGGGLGNSVAISGDTIVVGAPYATVGPDSLQGKVYVYVEPAGGWKNMTQTAELTASNQSGELGYFVSISGNTVLAGAPYTIVGSNQNQGAAYVFVKPATGWKNMTDGAELTASDGTSYNIFGWYVSLSGSTAVVGAPAATVGANISQGEAYVFVEPASGWVNMTQTATLTASDGEAGDGLGVSVGASGDTVVTGAYKAMIGSNSEQGAAYVFVKPASGWASTTQTAKLVASDGAAVNKLGWSLFTSGHTVVVAAPGFNNYQGAAYLFTEPASGWKNTSRFGAKLTASGAQQGDRLGWCVAIGGDAVVGGAPQVNFGSNTEQGAAYVFGP